MFVCKSKKSFLPNFTPILDNLSITQSTAGNYTTVYVYGSNYLPNGTTFVQFGKNGIKLPVVYYNSFTLSFFVPTNISSGKYDIQVINLYNGQFSPQINQTYPGKLNYSINSITYEIL